MALILWCAVIHKSSEWNTQNYCFLVQQLLTWREKQERDGARVKGKKHCNLCWRILFRNLMWQKIQQRDSKSGSGFPVVARLHKLKIIIIITSPCTKLIIEETYCIISLFLHIKRTRKWIKNSKTVFVYLLACLTCSWRRCEKLKKRTVCCLFPVKSYDLTAVGDGGAAAEELKYGKTGGWWWGRATSVPVRRVWFEHFF